MENNKHQEKKGNNWKGLRKAGLVLGIVTAVSIIWLLFAKESGVESNASAVQAQKEFQDKFVKAQQEFEQKVEAARKEAEEKSKS